MNVLSYKTGNDYYLYFELLVDGKLLCDLVDSQNTHFPYWIVEENMEDYHPHSLEHREPDTFIVYVCNGRGEYG
jgi:hypothetical protein